jgi:hypothetical protein
MMLGSRPRPTHRESRRQRQTAFFGGLSVVGTQAVGAHLAGIGPVDTRRAHIYVTAARPGCGVAARLRLRRFRIPVVRRQFQRGWRSFSRRRRRINGILAVSCLARRLDWVDPVDVRDAPEVLSIDSVYITAVLGLLRRLGRTFFAGTVVTVLGRSFGPVTGLSPRHRRCAVRCNSCRRHMLAAGVALSPLATSFLDGGGRVAGRGRFLIGARDGGASARRQVRLGAGRSGLLVVGSGLRARQSGFPVYHRGAWRSSGGARGSASAIARGSLPRGWRRGRIDRLIAVAGHLTRLVSPTDAQHSKHSPEQPRSGRQWGQGLLLALPSDATRLPSATALAERRTTCVVAVGRARTVPIRRDLPTLSAATHKTVLRYHSPASTFRNRPSRPCRTLAPQRAPCRYT